MKSSSNMNIDLSDKEAVEKLVKLCIEGDRLSQKTLYQLNYSKMLGVCLRYSENIDEAKDILHEGFIKVFNNLSKFENKGSLEGWIRRIINNTAIDHVRKKKELFVDYELDNVKGDDDYDPFEDLDKSKYTKLKADIVIKLIQKLPPAYRTVFNLFVVENYTHKEIAENLGISIGTSKSNLSKAKLKLKELFEKQIDELKL